MHAEHKYDRIERERRFILEQFPAQVNAIRVRRITDRYIHHTRLRLRHQTDSDGPGMFKLTQKIASPGTGAQQGFLTTMYLDVEEFRILAKLPAKELKKTRYSVPPFGIDVFEGSLAGLVLAEAEFETASEATSLILPSFIRCEVSEDIRFTGGRLVHASRRRSRIGYRSTAWSCRCREAETDSHCAGVICIGEAKRLDALCTWNEFNPH